MRICVSVRALELAIADPLSLGSLAPTIGSETWDEPKQSVVQGWVNGIGAYQPPLGRPICDRRVQASASYLATKRKLGVKGGSRAVPLASLSLRLARGRSSGFSPSCRREPPGEAVASYAHPRKW